MAPPVAHVPLEDKVRFLRRPDSYGERPARVEVKESHMSWVFLTERRAYKLKKPVRYTYLDFGTIEARRRNCEAEVRLNRRLAPDAYRGVVALTVEASGALRLGDGGAVCDWLVEMVRMPAEKTLDAKIELGAVDDDEIRSLAGALVRFYAAAERIPMKAVDYRRRFERDLAENRRELSRPEFGLPAEPTLRVSAAQRRFLEARAGLLDARAESGRIVEAHGDLRPEHIYLGHPPTIMDCLEFNRELRLLDPLDELAYLTLECRRLGMPRVGRMVLEFYEEQSRDHPERALNDFYASFRAMLRAKLAIWHLDDGEIEDRDKWCGRARAYLRLACEHAERLPG